MKILSSIVIGVLSLTCSAQHLDTTRLKATIDKYALKKSVPGITIQVTSNSAIWQGAAGNGQTDQPYFLASVTKLYTTAVVMKLREEGLLQLTDLVSTHLKNPWTLLEFCEGVTIQQLLSHTSGLPDYFEGKRKTQPSLFANLTQGIDESWTALNAVEWATAMGKLTPGGSKAKYSDTNFQILGLLIEELTGSSLDAAYDRYIYQPLGLKATHLFSEDEWDDVAPLYFGEQMVKIPMAMESFGPDGGMVSNLDESTKFLQAFFTGGLFPKSYLEGMKTWNKLFFPFEYGVGLAKFQMPGVPALIGHHGASGVFAFYCPELDTYITGTINQIDDPELPYKLLARILAVMK